MENEEINIKNETITNFQYYYLFYSLQVININKCKFKKNIFRLFISRIIEYPTLGWLFIINCKLKDEDIKLLIENFNSFKSLTCLNLKVKLPCTKLLKNYAYRCPTLTTINEESIEENIKRIKEFHELVMNGKTQEYNFKLVLFPSLINSFLDGKTLLHRLVEDEKYLDILIEVLKHNPSPFHSSIYSNKKPIDFAMNKNREVLLKYINKYSSLL